MLSDDSDSDSANGAEIEVEEDTSAAVLAE